MIIYTEKYTESESDIQNKYLWYKVLQPHQNTFNNKIHLFETFANKENEIIQKQNKCVIMLFI